MSVIKPVYGKLVNPALAISKSLLGYWLLNEGSLLVAHDSSGNGRDAAIQGTVKPSWTTGSYGSALSFTALSDQVVQVPTMASLVLPVSILVSLYQVGIALG